MRNECMIAIKHLSIFLYHCITIEKMQGHYKDIAIN